MTVCLPSGLFALSGPPAFRTAPRKECPSGSTQDSRLAAESILFEPKATLLMACEPAIDQTSASTANLKAIWRSDQILCDTWPSQLRSRLGPVLDLSLLICAASVAGVALATSAIMARENGAVILRHQVASAWKTFASLL